MTFHVSGNFPFCGDSSKMILKGTVIVQLQIGIIFIQILSHLRAFIGLTDFIIKEISFSLTWKDYICALLLYQKLGKVLV